MSLLVTRTTSPSSSRSQGEQRWHWHWRVLCVRSGSQVVVLMQQQQAPCCDLQSSGDNGKRQRQELLMFVSYYTLRRSSGWRLVAKSDYHIMRRRQCNNAQYTALADRWRSGSPPPPPPPPPPVERGRLPSSLRPFTDLDGDGITPPIFGVLATPWADIDTNNLPIDALRLQTASLLPELPVQFTTPRDWSDRPPEPISFCNNNQDHQAFWETMVHKDPIKPFNPVEGMGLRTASVPNPFTQKFGSPSEIGKIMS